MTDSRPIRLPIRPTSPLLWSLHNWASAALCGITLACVLAMIASVFGRRDVPIYQANPNAAAPLPSVPADPVAAP